MVHTFEHIETDIPPGVTVDEYRRGRPVPRRGLIARLRAALR